MFFVENLPADGQGLLVIGPGGRIVTHLVQQKTDVTDGLAVSGFFSPSTFL